MLEFLKPTFINRLVNKNLQYEIDPKRVVFSFGKHKDQTVQWVEENHPSYIIYFFNQYQDVDVNVRSENEDSNADIMEDLKLMFDSITNENLKRAIHYSKLRITYKEFHNRYGDDRYTDYLRQLEDYNKKVDSLSEEERGELNDFINNDMERLDSEEDMNKMKNRREYYSYKEKKDKILKRYTKNVKESEKPPSPKVERLLHKRVQVNNGVNNLVFVY